MLSHLEISRSRNLTTSGFASPEVGLTIGGIATSDLATAGELQLPKVSFIVRNWNYGRYVGRTIDSIRAQDYPNFEVVIVDNASTDDSRDVIERHIDNDLRFRVIHAETNLGPLGGGLLGLQHATGDFVAFIDSDDTLLSNFASAHIQVHLATQLSVAFTSSAVIETGPGGAMLNGCRARTSGKPENITDALRPNEVAPRLLTINDEAYATLSRNTRLLQPVLLEWPWSPGSSNMYRRFILDMLAPECAADDLPKLSADGHYNRLGHLLGGSALIDLPLSTYRIHGNNFAASTASLAHMGGDAGPATKLHSIRTREIMRVFVANSTDFSRRIGERRYWNGLNALFEMGSPQTPQGPVDWNRNGFFDEQVRRLAMSFGERAAIRKLAAFVPRPLLRSSLNALHGSNWPAHARLELHLSTARQMHARLKRFFRKRRARLSARLMQSAQS